MRHLVTGAGGFIGGHLVRHLLDLGEDVVATDIKGPDDWWQYHDGPVYFRGRDLMIRSHADVVVRDVDWVWHLACPMGGIGFITEQQFHCAHSALMTMNMLDASIDAGVDRFMLSSSACVYPTHLQEFSTGDVALTEDDAWPARPEPGYGLSKLFEEELCRYAARDAGLDVRVARFHNIYGPHGTWVGGKEKAPAAIARKVAAAAITGDLSIEVWGDGEQRRSFCYIDDCVAALTALMASDHVEPLNIGSAEMVTINDLVTITERIAGVTLNRVYDDDAPTGVRGRNSDNTRCAEVLGFAPSTPLEVGMTETFSWVAAQVAAQAQI